MHNHRLTYLDFAPGIHTESSPLSQNKRLFWVAGDKVRFNLGMPEQIGGWEATSIDVYNRQLLGRVSYIKDTQNLQEHKKLLIGTHAGLFASNTGEFKKVTPVIASVIRTNNINTVGNSSIVRIFTDVCALPSPFSYYPRMTVGTYVAFTSANTTIGGNITLCTNSSVTSPPYMVVNVTTNYFDIETNVTASISETSVGGTYSLFVYFMAGASSNPLQGWSGDVWSGNFPWSSPQITNKFTRARIWSMDWWGTDILAAAHSPLIYWDAQQGSSISNSAVFVQTAPSIIDIVRVDPVARFLCAYGTHTVSGQYDPLYVRWASQESYTDWTPTVTNTAGDFRLYSDGSSIQAVERVGDQFLIFTDKDVFVQQYIGGNDVFSFQRIATNCGVLSKNAVVVFGAKAYWMGEKNFFVYDGRVQVLPCSVARYVFDDLDWNQAPKIFGSTIAKHSEIIWFYPSLSDSDDYITENTRYVIYDVVDNCWTVGKLTRTCWIDRTVYGYPIAAGLKGEGLFYHEKGSTANGLPIESWIESNSIVMNDGNNIIFSNKIVPEIINPEGQPFTKEVDMYIVYKKYPNFEEIMKGPYPVSVSVGRISLRLRGRDFRVILRNTKSDETWRLGSLRMHLQTDGYR